MPLFEYVCEKCDGQFELLIRGDEKPACPKCGSRSVQRQLSVPAAHTSGGGPSGAFNTPCGMPPGSCGRQCGID